MGPSVTKTFDASSATYTAGSPTNGGTWEILLGREGLLKHALLTLDVQGIDGSSGYQVFGRFKNHTAVVSLTAASQDDDTYQQFDNLPLEYVKVVVADTLNPGAPGATPEAAPVLTITAHRRII